MKIVLNKGIDNVKTLTFAFFFGFQMRELRGTLNKAKVMENGKKCKKTWTSCFVVTTGSSLYIYKDQKSSTVKPNLPYGKPEFSLDLNGAVVNFGSQEKSSRKNVFHVGFRSIGFSKCL